MYIPWPSITRLRLTSANVVVYPPGASLARRHGLDFEFVWIMEGASVAYFDDQRLEAPPDTLLLRRPGVYDRYDWAREHRTVHAYFHFACRIPRAGWPPVERWPMAQRAHGDDILRPLFRYILNAHLMAEPLRSAMLTPAVDLMLKAFVTGKLSLAAQPQVDLPPPVEKAMECIRRATFYGGVKAVTLADLARAAHVTPEHLCRVFRKSLNLGPLECARLARLQLASMLLGRSAMTIKEVADAAGFANPYHFSRVFRDAYGLPPRHYRHAVAAATPVPPNPIVRLLRLENP